MLTHATCRGLVCVKRARAGYITLSIVAVESIVGRASLASCAGATIVAV